MANGCISIMELNQCIRERDGRVARQETKRFIFWNHPGQDMLRLTDFAPQVMSTSILRTP